MDLEYETLVTLIEATLWSVKTSLQLGKTDDVEDLICGQVAALLSKASEIITDEETLSVLTEYKTVLEALILVSQNESKRAHKALSSAVRNAGSATYLIYLTKVYLEIEVSDVLGIEKSFVYDQSNYNENDDGQGDF